MALQGICTRANISPRKWLDMCVSLSSIHNVWAVMWKVVVCAGLFPSLPTSRYLPQNTHQQCNWVRYISVYSGTVCTRCTICSKKRKTPSQLWAKLMRGLRWSCCFCHWAYLIVVEWSLWTLKQVSASNKNTTITMTCGCYGDSHAGLRILGTDGAPSLPLFEWLF